MSSDRRSTQRIAQARRVPLALRQSKLFNAVTHLVAVDPQQVPGVRLVSATAVQRLHDQLAFDLLEVHSLRGQSEGGRDGVPRQRTEVIGDPVRGQNSNYLYSCSGGTYSLSSTCGGKGCKRNPPGINDACNP